MRLAVIVGLCVSITGALSSVATSASPGVGAFAIPARVMHRQAISHPPRRFTSQSFVGTVTTMANFSGFVSSLTYDTHDGNYYAGTFLGLEQVTPNGQVSMFANAPSIDGVVFDAITGNFYATSAGSSEVLSITPTGTVAVLAGGSFGTADGQGAAAQFQFPSGITIDPALHVLYVFDGTSIRKVDTSGNVTTLGPFNTFLGGPFQREPIAFDSALKRIAVLDTTANLLRLFDPHTGKTQAFIGRCLLNGSFGSGCAPFQLDGRGAQALLAGPNGIVYDAASDALFLADTANLEIRRVSSAGVVTTIAGNGRPTVVDGVHLAASFQNPTCMTLNPVTRSLVVCDNNVLRFVTATGANPPPVATFVMAPAPTLLSGPTSIARTSDGSLWFTENSHNYIGRRLPTGVLQEFSLPGGFQRPNDVIAAGTGVWFVDESPFLNGQTMTNAYIARMSGTGAVQENLFPNHGGSQFNVSTPSNLTLDAIGNIWFTGSNPSSFGVMTPSRRIVQYAASFGGMALTTGPTIWGTSQYYQQLFKYSANGVLQQTYANLPDDSGIAAAPNGHLWLLSDRYSQVMDFDPKSSTAIAYSLPQCGCFRVMGNPTFGPDGALYFTEGASNFFNDYPPTVGRITTAGVFTEFPIYEPRGQPSGITFDSHGVPWISDVGANKIGFLGSR